MELMSVDWGGDSSMCCGDVDGGDSCLNVWLCCESVVVVVVVAFEGVVFVVTGLFVVVVVEGVSE
jgi:hypothetical protein